MIMFESETLGYEVLLRHHFSLWYLAVDISFGDNMTIWSIQYIDYIKMNDGPLILLQTTYKHIIIYNNVNNRAMLLSNKFPAEQDNNKKV